MTKGNILEDSFEKIVEEGGTAVKKSVKSAAQQVKQTVNPAKLWEELLGVSQKTDSLGSKTSELNDLNKKSSEVKTGGRHTPLDLEKLGKSYQNNDRQKKEQL